jgi:hypothetical protein
MSALPDDEYVVDFPTLWVGIDWIEAHCIVPDRDLKGRPFVMYDWQLWCAANHYRVKPTALVGDLNTAFFYRRSLIIAPQKTGKGPWAASIIILEALGPCLFNGWAEGGEQYRCKDFGCGCGWTYTYQPGEPMGRPWATPLIQLTATSDDQTDNVYEPLKSMLRYGPLAPLVTVGEEFTRTPNDGKIETVTSSALSRLGNPIIFALQDETQLYTTNNKLVKVARTQRRGAAGMGGRSMETTNPWDPSEDSVAQQSWQSKAPDIFKFWRDPDKAAHLRHSDGTPFKFSVARERRKILQYVYKGSTHVVLDSVDAEAVEVMERDPGEAERFFGNREVAGLGTWCPRETWTARAAPRDVLLQEQVVVGFDGSDVDDWTGFRCQTRDGHQFTPEYADGEPMIWDPADYGGQVPRLEVSAALDLIMSTFNVARVYADPPYWESEIDAWAAKYGEQIVFRWYTRRVNQMHAAAERLLTDLRKRDSGFSHDGCQITEAHVTAAKKARRGGIMPGSDETTLKYVLTKPGDGRKIDMAIPSILANQAHGDVTSAGWPTHETSYAYVM